MKGFFNRREEIEDLVDEDEGLEVIDLDETAGWSKLELAEEMARRQAADLMEEIGDELAIIDVVEEDVEIETLQDDVVVTKGLPKDDTEYISAEDEERMYQRMSADSDDEAEIEYLSVDGDEEEAEYLSEEDEEEMEEYDSPFAFFENLADWFSRWTVLDKVVAVTGVLVLVVAVLTGGVYAVNRGMDKQIEAFAPVGQKLETVGLMGTDKLLAVADSKKAMLEAAKLEAELNQEYEEKELSSEIKVVMKMTSVQKDLKIKFVNKKTGKLVGNVPFEVKIVDGENKTYNKIDEDKDGIIYLTKITPGDYSVSMVELSGVEGYSFNTTVEKIKVKENIEYQKIDVSEEIKDQSEVDVSKEDTAQKVETEATLTDTVEWVESTKKESGSQEAYTQVNKDTIADPSLSASLKLDLSILRIMQQSRLANTGVNAITETPVEGVSLDKSEATMKVGETLTLTPTVSPEGATNKEVTWSSSDSAVVSVNGGAVKAEKAGTATITVTTVDGGKTATCNITVEEANVAVSEITLNAATLTLEAGKTGSLTATVKPDNATNASVTWSSKDTSVATVDNGTVAALAKGTTEITAKAGEMSATCTVTVTESTIAVTKITLSSTALTLKAGENGTLTATVEPGNATDTTVTWSSDKESVAKVDGTGKVTAVAEGTANITARAGNQTATCVVTVSKATAAVTGVKLNKNTLSLKAGASETLTATVEPSNASDKSVKWSSDKTDIATVDANGKVTAVKEGSATITVTTVDGSKTASCVVTVTKAYDAKNDNTKLLRDKSGNQIYVLVNGQYVEAKVADYFKYTTFYKKEKVSEYVYTGWQNLDGKTYYFDKNGNKVTGAQVIQGAQYNFNSDGTLNTGSGILGIDVSTWNGNIDWNKVKNSGVSYVIIRTGFRGSTQGSLVEDNKFRQNIQGATNAGLKVGVYFFSQAINEVEAVEEASMVLSQVKGYKLTYPVFIDVEPSGGRADGLSSGDRTKVINAFCQTIQNGGLRAGVYANKTWLSQKMNVSALSGYKIWLAQYNSKVTYGGRYDMWQYSDKGKVSGISGNVDMNLSYLSY